MLKLQYLAQHQVLARAAGNADALAVELLPDLVGTVHLQIDLPDAPL